LRGVGWKVPLGKYRFPIAMLIPRYSDLSSGVGTNRSCFAPYLKMLSPASRAARNRTGMIIMRAVNIRLFRGESLVSMRFFSSDFHFFFLYFDMIGFRHPLGKDIKKHAGGSSRVFRHVHVVIRSFYFNIIILRVLTFASAVSLQK
jgi:hypothetical protein